jgi:cyclohexanone monooxygenase
MNTKDQLRVGVIGAGPAGIAAGRELLSRGFTDVTLFEATDGVGGTWHIHTYPGLACDVWAHSYSFSYRPNPDWSHNFVEQPEIEAYLRDCAREFGLDDRILLNTRIARARFSSEGVWDLESEDGRSFQCDVLINAMGNQHTPLFPKVQGHDSFAGPSFHATRWDHAVDLADKRVVLVGSAASAVQVVPEIAPIAGHLTVLQRSPNWIMPRGRRPYTERRRRWFRQFPTLMRWTQRFQRFLMSFVHDAATLGHARMKDFEKRARKHIETVVADPELRQALTPSDPYGCKRGLVSDDFYPALQRPNVELVPEALAAVRPAGITTASGREIDADVIIYCTGYRILDFDRIDVVGRDGVRMSEVMQQAPEAFKGIAAPDFPNYFFAVGPNGLPLDAPYFVTVERNVETIVDLLSAKEKAGARTIAVRPEAHRRYNDWLRDQFPRYSWASPTCSSYYTDAQGRAPFLFPGRFVEYAALHEEAGAHEFDLA